MQTEKEIVKALVEVAKDFSNRGWAPVTSGNYSAVLSRRPLRMAITASGISKKSLSLKQIVVVNDEGNLLRGGGKPSSDTQLHLAAIDTTGAGSVIHTHSVWSTLISHLYTSQSGILLEGYAILKALANRLSGREKIWIPILAGSQDYNSFSSALSRSFVSAQNVVGVLLRDHGLYAWGEDLAEAARTVEVLEFLLEVAGRLETAASGFPQQKESKPIFAKPS